MNKKYDVGGMTCASCVANVTKVVEKLNGVKDVNVNLMTNSMKVNFDEEKLNDEIIINAVENVGYSASVPGEKSKELDIDEREENLKHRLIYSTIFMLILMYVAMGHMIHLPIPHIFMGTSGAIIFAFTQFLLALPVIYINRDFYISGFKGLKNKAPNMDTLVAIGSSAAMLYGIFAIYMMAYGFGTGNLEIVDRYRENLYFESAAMILTLITVGKYLEEKSKNKTRNSISKLMDLAPKMATVIENDKEVVKNVEDISLGDIILVRPGESVAVDGEVVEGASSVDESAVTGESIPVSKSVGDKVISASINTTGSFKFVAQKVGEDTTISQIIALVDEANQSKAPIAKLADKISGIFVPAVLLISLVTFILWMAFGYGFENALNFAISVLVISCPCALGLATPVSIMVATGKSADFGLLFKNAEILENLHKIDTVVMDKTGTITKGKPVVTDIVTNLCENEFVKIAASIEKSSQHPLANAILNYAEEKEIYPLKAENFHSVSGRGVVAEINGKKYFTGNREYMEEENISLEGFDKKAEKLAEEGNTSMYFADSKKVIGIISVKDVPKENSKKTIKLLQDMNKKVIMLTGDNENTAASISKDLGIDKTYAGLLPQDKNKIIEEIQKFGKKVLMIGDGINDAPSLAIADIGMAIGSGTDVAIDSSDVVLMRDDLIDIVSAIELSKATIKNIKQNLFWAFFYNIIGIPIAAGVFFIPFGIKLSPMFGAFAMSLSSVFVVNNALRLRRFRPKSVGESYTKPVEKSKVNTNRIIVEDMTCEHCEKKVADAINNTGKAKNAKANYKSGVVEFIDFGISREEVKKAVENAGYKLNENIGGNNMEKILKVEGMNCNHCVASVTKALEGVAGVEKAEVSLDNKEAVVTLKEDVDNKELEKAVADAGFTAKAE